MSLACLLDRLAGHPAIRRRKKRLRPARFIVEEFESRHVLNGFTVVSADGGEGPGTLFDAIGHANAGNEQSDPNPFEITFNIHGTGVQTISLEQPLPQINHPVTIDGTTEAESQNVSSPTPLIEIDGSLAGDTNGLDFKVGGNTVKDLIINNFTGASGANGFGIVLDGSNDSAHGQGPGLNNIIQGNFIGTDSTGKTAVPNNGGIDVFSSSFNLIGGLNANGQLTNGNLISGNNESGVFLSTAGDSHNYIEGNYIGTDVTGLEAVPNKLDGVALVPPLGALSEGFASNNVIGDFDPNTAQFNTNGRNIISGNTQNGVLIVGGSLNQVTGNYIGIGSDGATPVANGEDGVRLEDAGSNLVGGMQTGTGNVISGNLHNGVEIVSDTATEQGLAIPVASQGASGNRVQENFIGTDVTGMLDTVTGQTTSPIAPLGNGQDGIVLRNLSTDPSASVALNLIGGDDASDGVTDGVVNARNFISGNLGSGVELVGAGVTLNTLEGNYIGTDKNGAKALSNGFVGVDVNSGPSNNIIGGNTLGSANVISGNSTPPPGTTPPAGQGDGVLISNASNTNLVEGNKIGTTADGKAALANLIGIQIANSAGNVIGGSQTADANLISGNTQDGVTIAGATSKNNALYENLIGLDSAGGPLGNLDVGVLIQDHAFGNLVGGTQTVGGVETSLGNSIATNGIGTLIQGGSENNQVVGNLIGSAIISGKPSTNLALANGVGVSILDADKNIVGGLTAATRNIIVNSDTDGVDINDTNGIADSGTVVTTGNVVEGNYIGILNDGATRLANGGDGVEINGAAGNTIGGIVQGSRNVISGNGVSGVLIDGKAATGNTVAGNWIGTTDDGATAVITGFTVDPNNLERGSGVLIKVGASQNVIGLQGPFGGNVISGNPSSGMILTGAGPDNVIENNDIGLNSKGLGPLQNQGVFPARQNYGISIASTSGTIIGAASFTLGGNVISGNAIDGILLSDSPTIGTQIEGNDIGTDKAAAVPVGNGGFGIDITSLSPTLGPASNTTVINNVVSGNSRGGILMSNGASSNQLVNNFIGINSQISNTIPNLGVGIEIDNAPNNTIGGADRTLGNDIQNNQAIPNPPQGADPSEVAGQGILITGASSSGNHVENNVIAGNANHGVMISASASNNFIGGAAQGNSIFNNGNDGIAIANASGNIVQANLIGVNGDQPAGNMHNGILLSSADGNLIGTGGLDPTRSLANVISANKAFAGVILASNSNGNTVAGNLIGTNPQGAAQQGFGSVSGIQIVDSSNNFIGGLTQSKGEAPGNEILGNGAGLLIHGMSQGNKIQGNNISDSVSFANTAGVKIGAGIIIDSGASNNFIGGPNAADGNTISNNTNNGTLIASGNGDSIGNNLIFGNDAFGIVLEPGTNANNQQQPPTLSLATTGASHRLAGYITGAPNTLYYLQFFAGDDSEHGDNSEDDDAEKIVKVSTGLPLQAVQTDKGGVALFDLVLPADVLVNSYIRATATDSNGNTSQFSNAVHVLADDDGDGVPDAIEALSPIGGNGNPSLVSFPDALNANGYITLKAPDGVQIQNAWSTPDPEPNDTSGPPNNVQFNLGFVSFQLTNFPQPPAPVIVTMSLPVTLTAPTSYWRYGPTQDNQAFHWYNWIWDGNPNHTGAEILGNTIKLHLIDGALGDDDLSANGIIVDPGGPGFPDPYTVTTTADSGSGSLRQAILNANANPFNTITFDLPGTGPQAIQLLSPLPALTAGVTINGSTEPGFAGKPLVVLDGSQAGAGADGLTVASGAATIQDLVINQFSGDGIHVLSAGSVLIAGNYIGTDPSGKLAKGNGLYGVEIDADTSDAIDTDNDGDDDNAADNKDTDNDVNSSQPSTIDGGNIISGNLAGGISIHGVGASFTSVTGNYIGTQADGISPLGNGGPGVVIDGESNTNTIGFQPKTGNTIAFNAGPGVEIVKGIDNLIESNSIFANQGLGIDLAGGPNANESQSAPVLASAASYGGETFISGTLTSTPNSSYTIDFYANDKADPSAFGQGQLLLGSVSVTTDNDGQASFDSALVATAAPGSSITATASLNDNETSEFSADVTLTPTNPLVLIVNTTNDVNDAVPDPTHFSLREAILAANAHPGQDIIHFDLPNTDRAIQPQSALPTITDPVIIDGTSQPGYRGLPLVELDGSLATAGANGLDITGGGSVVRGLVIHSFVRGTDAQGDPIGGNAIEISGGGGNVIAGNFLGTDVTGTRALSDQSFRDVEILGSPDNVIGGTTDADRNVVNSVAIEGLDPVTGQALQNAGGNHVEGNYIGTDLTGTAALAGAIDSGVSIGSSGNTVGGTEAGAGNLIVGSLEIGEASSNVVQGNLIGTNYQGTAALEGSATVSPITSASGSKVTIFGQGVPTEQNLIGGNTPAARNIIVGTVIIQGTDALLNDVEGNYIGTDITGTVPLGLGIVRTQTSSEPAGAVEIEGAFNTIGGAQPGEGNLISGNSDPGISLSVGAHNNLIQGNFIGTDVTGTKALGNFGNGIGGGILSEGEANTIGGTTPGAGNLIAGNNGSGVVLNGNASGSVGAVSFGDVVKGNRIGTDVTGTVALGNGVDGIDVEESGAIIGGSQPGQGNIISGNAASGISVHVGGYVPSGASIQGNYIGTDLTASAPLGNGGDGINISGPSQNDIIGGPLPGAGNVIANNGGDGIRFVDQPEEGDAQHDIPVAASGAIIQGNKIGTDVTGTRHFGNAGDGISFITSYAIPTNETIGGAGPGAGNLIAFNGGRGVDLPFGDGNAVRANDIFDNGGLGLITDINAAASTYAENRGIQLAQSVPVLSSAVFDPQGTVVSGSLTGTPFTRYEIDFFANDAVNPSGFGDGQTYLQSISVLVDDTGSVEFQIPLDAAVPIGQWITATATPDSTGGNTSMFSQSTPVIAAVGNTLQFSSPNYLVTVTGSSAVIVVTRSGDTSSSATVDYATSDGTATTGVNYTAESGTLTFAAGVASETIAVPVADDGQADGNKDFHILLANASGSSLGAVTDADVTIADSDSAGEIQFSSSSDAIDKSLSAAVFTISRTGGSQVTVSVDFRVTGGTAVGVPVVFADEVVSADYIDDFGTVTFAPGQTTAQITVNYVTDLINGTLGDPEYRGPRSVELTLGNPTGGATLGAITSSTMTIDDPEDQVGEFWVDGTQEVKENAGQAQIEVLRSGNQLHDVNVAYTTVDGTAKAGANYVATHGFVEFKPGQEAAVVNVPILDDHLVHNDGTFQFVISGAAEINTGVQIPIFPGLNQSSITILDSDNPLPARFEVQTNQSFGGDSGTAQVTVDRFDNTSGSDQVSYATSDGTAKAGTDYQPASGTLTFAPGQTSLTFSVPLLATNALARVDTFEVSLSNPVSLTDPDVGATIDPNNPVPVTLVYNTDSAQFVVPGYPVAANNANLTITVSLTPAVGPQFPFDFTNQINPITVGYTTHDGTATEGVDYTAVSGTLTFDFNAETNTITIPILNDQAVSGDKTFSLTLTDPQGGLVLGDQSTTTITILNGNGPAPTITKLTSDQPIGSTYGQTVTLTATVTAGSGTPTGSVDFVDSSTRQDLGSSQLAVLDGVDGASVSVSSLAAGSHNIVATYTSDNSIVAGSHDSLSQTVSPAALIVTADNKTMAYGATVPPLTDTINGFVNGDTSSVVSGAADINTTAAATSPVGTYPIVVSQGTLSAANYTFAFVNGTLTVTANDNTPVLELIHDTAASATESSSATLTSTQLETTDSDSSVSASTILYTITAVPTLGSLADDGIPLGMGGKFSQLEINDGAITYQSTKEGADSFAFSVASGAALPITGTLAISISDPSVTATGGFTVTATAGNASASQTVATFTDPAGAEDLAHYAATIDWGDGASSAGEISYNTPSGVFTVAGSHDYGTSSTNMITVTLTHEGTPTVTVQSAATVSGTSTQSLSGAGIAVNGFELSPLSGVAVATFTLSGGSVPAGDFSATIDWGDGVTSSGDVALSSGTYTVSGSHIYGDEGTYSLSVTITGGGLTTTVPQKVTILEALLPDGTRGTANQNYVQETYRDVLHRAPDQGGLDYWTAKLDAGEGHAQLAYEIVRVAFPREEQLDEVQSLYETYLHRAPEPAGLQFWAAFLYDDGTDEEMVQDLVSSPEYLQARGSGTNDGFLDALFHDALGRAVDPQTRVFFDTAMANGATPAQVAALIFGSEEYRRDLVSGWYEQFLDRPADPLGVDAFVGELADGQRDEQIIAEFVASDEYFAKAQR